ncbi:MAG TPA: cytochrome P450 [Vicinamibacterales bacterium]|nr:cytochrome P450 [Vicinamibacterales bacterium]
MIDVVAFRRDKLGYLERCAAAPDPVVPVPMRSHTWLLKDARDVQHVLQTHPERYEKGSQRRSAAGVRLAGAGLLTLAGDAHLARKRALQPMFAQAAIAPFAEAAVTLAEMRASSWADGRVVDVAVEMARLAQDVITRALLGRDARRADEFAAAIRDRRRYIQYWFDYPVPGRDRLPLPVVWRHRQASRVIGSILRDEIARRRESGVGNDLLSLLLAARGADDRGLDDDDVADEARTIALTGYETVAEALTWTWHLLACHDDVAARVREEVESATGGRRVASGDYDALRYTRQVIAEAMRLYPPTWLFTRTVVVDDRLPSGSTVAAGSSLYLCPWIVHRRAEYFPDPQRFDPERFAEGRTTWPPFAYFPFGGGRHVCIGQALARHECALIVATIVRILRLRSLAGQRVVPEPAITLTPKGGLPMTVERAGRWPAAAAV